MIAAMAKNRVIGKENGLPWDIPEDMKYFMTTTQGKLVIMGRKTFDSLGKPLPKRVNYVVTRNPGFKAQGVQVFSSLASAVNAAKQEVQGKDDEIFIIGGEEIYRQGLSFADRIYLTEIDREFPGDTIFPEFDKTLFRETSHRESRQGDLRYSFNVYDR